MPASTAVDGPGRSFFTSARRVTARGAARLASGVVITVLVFLTTVFVMAAQPYWPAALAFILLIVLALISLKLARRFGVGLIVLIVATGFVVGWSQLSTATPPIRDARGNVVAGSIATIERVKLGGIDQVVLLRGRDVRNPVLLYLAGGPGGTQIAWNQQLNKPLEDRFVVAQWEQRGAGKSGGAVFADWEHMTPTQYTSDGLELVAWLRDRYGPEPIYLVAQSWGTMPGIWMINQRPEWFAGYVGIGQMVSPVETDTLGYEYVLAHARAEGRDELVATLESYGPPPYHGVFNMTRYQRLIGAMNEYQAREIASDPYAQHPNLVGMTDSPEYGIADTVAAFVGGGITFARVYDQLDDVDLDSQVTSVDVPVWFVEGRHDLNSFPVLAERYLEVLQAPGKQLVWFEHSGHNPMHEDAARFNAFMVTEVLARTVR